MWPYILVMYFLELYLMSSCHIPVAAASFEINNGMQRLEIMRIRRKYNTANNGMHTTQ